MFKVTPTTKQIRKITGNNSNKIPTLISPKDWGNFVSLTTIRSGGSMIKFTPYDYQKLIIKLSYQFPNIIILKSRQLGITQCVVSSFLHDSCINPASSSICFMRNAEDASAISRRTRQMLQSIPDYAVPANDNVGYLKIAGGGDIYFKNSGREGSRSLDSCTAQLFDEAAFVDNIASIYAASSPSAALVQNVRKFIVSTPSAKNNWYWEKLSENNGGEDIELLAEKVADGSLYKDYPGMYWFVDTAGTCKIILHYSVHPVYKSTPDYLEYRLQQDGTDLETVQREYNLKFIDSSVSIFDSNLIKKCAVGNFEDCNPKLKYYAGLDTSTVGNDYCVFSVFKWENEQLSLVFIYRKRKETSDYHLYQIGEIIQRYQIDKVGVETTGGVGQLYLEQLSKQHKRTKFEAIRTTGDSKPIMIANLQLALEKQQLIFPQNCPLVDELLSFRRSGKRLEAVAGKHDDCVMSTAFGVTVSPLFNKKKGFFGDVRF